MWGKKPSAWLNAKSSTATKAPAVPGAFGVKPAPATVATQTAGGFGPLASPAMLGRGEAVAPAASCGEESGVEVSWFSGKGRELSGPLEEAVG